MTTGVALGLQLQLQGGQKTQVIIMTGGELTVEEEAICNELDIPITAEAVFSAKMF